MQSRGVSFFSAAYFAALSSTILRTIARSPAMNGVTCLKPVPSHRWNFTIPAQLDGVVGKMTFLDALQGGGGPGLNGAVKILLRAAVAADLNAAHEDVGYPYRRLQDPFRIQSQVNAALHSLDRQTMLDLAAVLDAANNLGCPLN